MRCELNYLSTDYIDYFQGCSDPLVLVEIHQNPTIKSIAKAICQEFDGQILDQILDLNVSFRQCMLIAPIVLGVWERWLEDESNRQKFDEEDSELPTTFLRVVPMQGKIRL